MNGDLSNHRKSYEKGELLKKDVPENPLELFQKWFHEVSQFFPEIESNAMTLSTIGLAHCSHKSTLLCVICLLSYFHHG